MYGYKIKKYNNEWYFEFIPNNNNNQEMGRSKNYSSLSDCQNAIEYFREFVVKNSLNVPTENKLIIKEDNGYFFQYIDNDELIFWRTNQYGNKGNCYKGIKSIYKHIDKYTSKRLEL
jgi:uncharacterized protein YegP (UPF0339 family)